MIDRVLRFLGVVAMVTLVAIGTAFFASGEWEAWKAVRDARPDLAVAELREQAADRDARIASVADDLAAARAEVEVLRSELAAAKDEIARLEGELGNRIAFGDEVVMEPEPRETAAGVGDEPNAAGEPAGDPVGGTGQGTWRLTKAEK